MTGVRRTMSVSADTSTVIEIAGLKTHFKLDEGLLRAVDGVDLSVAKNKTLGIIGESGCGKSVTAQSILQIVPSPGRITDGRILFRSGRGLDVDPLDASPSGDNERVVDIARLSPTGEEMRKIRGREIGIVFQEPMTSLSPVHTIGSQIAETVVLHEHRTKAEARELTIEMLTKVGISNPSQRVDEYPHQLSGGMRQRAMIAMALICHPSLLLADEPTTALDVTVQAQIIELTKSLQAQFNMAIIYITHDLGVIADVADEVAVMYLGRVVEQAPARTIFRHPLHPYTRRLLKSIPKLGAKAREPLDVIPGNVPIPIDLPPMCGFCSRCSDRIAGVCDRSIPALVELEDGHRVRCFLHSDAKELVDG